MKRELGEIYDILLIFETRLLPALALILLVITMIAFYSTTLDGITYVTSSYSYKRFLLQKKDKSRVK